MTTKPLTNPAANTYKTEPSCIMWHIDTPLVYLSLPLLATAMTTPYKLQEYHAVPRPSDIFSQLSSYCNDYNVSNIDTYGDFAATADTSFIKRLENGFAQEFGMPHAVLMPSGVMAQNIALLINNGKQQQQSTRAAFVCHQTSHLLLHENEAYDRLLDMTAIATTNEYDANTQFVQPMSFVSVKDAIDKNDDSKHRIHTVIIELPHREIGGKCTSIQDLVKIREYCHQRGIKLHCDGARIFESSTFYFGDKVISLADLQRVIKFDSIYVSLYKGLEGLAGAVLLCPDSDYCDQARIWLRRFGGNLYTLLPYAVAGWHGYQQHWKAPSVNEARHDVKAMSFAQKKEKLTRIVQQLSQDRHVKNFVAFDPATPHVNMVHGYIKQFEASKVLAMADEIKDEIGIQVLFRARDLSENDVASKSLIKDGYRCKFEWTMGSANSCIDDEIYYKGWNALAKLMFDSCTDTAE